MAQLAILLVGQHFVTIAGVEVRNLSYRSRFESAVWIVRIPFYYARVTGGVVDKEVVVASAHGVHVVGRKQVDGLLRGSRAVEHQADGERSVDDGALRVLVTGFGIQGEYGNGYAAFVNTVELGKRAHECGGTSGDGVKRSIIVQVVKGGEPDGGIAAARVIAHQQRRGVVLKVVIATGAYAAFGIYGDKSAAGKLGRLDMCRHTGQHLRHHGIDVGLVVAHIGCDDAVKVVVVGDVDAVQVIAVCVASQAFERRGGLDLFAVNDAGGSGKADGDTRGTAGDGSVTWLHDGSSRPVSAIVAKGARA